MKRKTGFLSYSADNTGTAGILARSFPKLGTLSSSLRKERTIEEFIGAFVDDPEIKAFVHNFCAAASPDDKDAAFFTAVLYECLTREKPEILPTYIALWKLVRGCEPEDLSLAALAELRLIRAYYQHTAIQQGDWFHQPLIQVCIVHFDW